MFADELGDRESDGYSPRELSAATHSATARRIAKWQQAPLLEYIRVIVSHLFKRTFVVLTLQFPAHLDIISYRLVNNEMESLFRLCLDAT